MICVAQELGQSIWFAQNTTSSRGMVEYYPGSGPANSAPIIKYPANFEKMNERTFQTKHSGLSHMIANKYKAGSVVIVDPQEGSGIVFDTTTREYSDMFSFQARNAKPPKTRFHDVGLSNRSGTLRFRGSSSCVAIGDYIHIFNGSYPFGSYTICSLKDNTSRNFISQPEQEHAKLRYVDVVKPNGCYQASDEKLISGFARQQCASDIPSVIVDVIQQFSPFELYKFGGKREFPPQRSGYFPVDTFYIGVLENGDAAQPIKWSLEPNYKMKHPMEAFGCINFGPFIVTFGGLIGMDRDALTDAIYVLDLRSKSGWIQSRVKCPIKSTYHAVIDEAQTVHLFAVSHFFRLQLKDIILGTSNYRLRK